jgi:hypothetical protein
MVEETDQLLRDIRDATIETRDAMLRMETERTRHVRFERRMIQILFCLVAVVMAILGYLIFRIVPELEKQLDEPRGANAVSVSQSPRTSLLARHPVGSTLIERCQAGKPDVRQAFLPDSNV